MPQNYAELESVKDPLLYELLKKMVKDIQTNAGNFIRGAGSPNGKVTGIPNQLYIDKSPDVPSGAQSLWIKTGYPGTKTGWLPLHSQTPALKSALTYPNLFVDPQQSGFRAFGSVPPASMSGFAYTATATTATIFWDGTNGSTLLSIRRSDNTKFTVNATLKQTGPQAVSGLTNTNTYKVYPYWDETISKVQFVKGLPGAVGTPKIMFPTAVPGGVDTLATTDQLINAVQAQSLKMRIPLSAGGVAVTAAAGGNGNGGGSGSGGACFHESMLFEFDTGVGRIGNVIPFDTLIARSGPTVVESVSRFGCKDWVKIGFSNGDAHIVTPRHLVTLGEDMLMEARRLTVGGNVAERSGGRVTIESVEMLREEGVAVCIRCKPDRWVWAGMKAPTVLAHNVVKI